jgi:hypothetical protein
MSMPDNDAFARLRDANPAPRHETPAPQSAQALALLARVVATQRDGAPTAPPARRRRAFRLLVPAALLSVAAGYLIVSNVTAPLHVTCFAEASLEEGDVAVMPADGSDPIALCAEVWSAPDLFDAGTVPPLAACVLEDGSVGVFPGEQGTCAGLGRAAVEGDMTTTSAVVELRDALVSRFDESGCLGSQGAGAVVVAELDAVGLSGWSVRETAPFTRAEPCAALAFDEEGRTVLLVPMEDYGD